MERIVAVMSHLFYTFALSLCMALILCLIGPGESQRSSHTANQVRPADAPTVLQCYQCTDQPDNVNCSRPSDLKQCTDPGNNVCSTKVSRSPELGIRISKYCGMGPCSLDAAGTRALGIDSCDDRRLPQWECSSCCSTTACNVNAVAPQRQGLLLPLLLTGLLVAPYGQLLHQQLLL